ncbi:hypothetical protein WICMUC_002298 [Wickerhamomyces mucosus]|uniref:Exocyst complex protein EXO70 n=1 Tax=Wickerhamomyces mucosus TaxID=1378264 RepID=A0A9P8PQZ5_9ASCO|nr:hypothetical protein WICMUC_002298 [Wickerhamomyces mucosus]
MSYAQFIIDADEAGAVVLQESLTKTRNLISQISLSLDKISKSSSKSEVLLGPIIQKHSNLRTFKKNVDESLLAVSNIQGIASEAAMYETRLNQRNIENVKQYITTIHKAEDVLQKLSSENNNGNGEFKGISENLSKTILDGEFRLKMQFKEILAPISDPFDPQIFINERKPFPYLEDTKVRNLAHIMNFFKENNKPLDQQYIENRSRVVGDSLAILAPFTQHAKKNAKVPYERGSNGINNYTEALLGFIANESSLLEDIFKKNPIVVNEIFFKVFDQPVTKFTSIIENIINATKQNLANDGLLVFETIDNIVKVQSMLMSSTGKSYTNLTSTLDTCRMVARSLFRELLLYTEQRVKSLTSIPQDNGICEVTVEIMSKARKFAEHRDGALDVMKGLRAGSWIPQPKPQWINTFSSISQTNAVDDSNPIELLSSFFLDIIDALIVSLEIKAVQLNRKKQTIGYFLITNITLVEQIIARSDLKLIINQTGFTRLEKLKKRAMNLFLSGWKQAAAYLLDVNVVGKLTSKDRDAIKEKFKNFNAEFDELIRDYKQYNITDPSLKKFLSKEISFIIPLYHRFHDKHAQGDFTKNTDKYIKYDKKKFDSILDSLAR